MAEIGLFLSSGEHGSRSLVTQARQAEEAGLRSVFISDHFHPWLERQGENPLVWFDELHIGQIGPDVTGFLSFYDRELRGRIECGDRRRR